MPNFIPCDPNGVEPIFIPCKDKDGLLHALGDAPARRSLCGSDVTEVVHARTPVAAVCGDCSTHITNLADAVADGRLRSVQPWASARPGIA